MLIDPWLYRRIYQPATCNRFVKVPPDQIYEHIDRYMGISTVREASRLTVFVFRGGRAPQAKSKSYFYLLSSIGAEERMRQLARAS